MASRGSSQSLSASNAQQLLFVLRGANMTLTTDQAFTKQFGGTTYQITSVSAVRKTGAFGVACVGGIYDTASKAGNALIAAAQVWSALTGANTIQTATLAAIAGSVASTATPFLSLTTGNTGALTADLFIWGVVLD